MTYKFKVSPHISTVACNLGMPIKLYAYMHNPQYDKAVGSQFQDLRVLTTSLRIHKDLDRLLLFRTYSQVERSCLCASIRSWHDEITYLLHALWLVCCSKKWQRVNHASPPYFTSIPTTEIAANMWLYSKLKLFYFVGQVVKSDCSYIILQYSA